MKLNRQQYLAQLTSMSMRLWMEMERIDEELLRFKSLKRNTHYRHIGEMPSTGYASIETNPEQFISVDGYPVLLNGLLGLARELEMYIHVIGEHTNHDESTDIQHTP